ncbi:MAG: hypothetical protein F6J95_029130 [Leptolyngbya sp. SIO1E4]|nr:hypothetical protein [Leptolyngbya sp. SIO1E4]
MNAASQAITLELTSKIAHLAVLFRAEFPDARVDLSPWQPDPITFFIRTGMAPLGGNAHHSPSRQKGSL